MNSKITNGIVWFKNKVANIDEIKVCATIDTLKDKTKAGYNKAKETINDFKNTL